MDASSNLTRRAPTKTPGRRFGQLVALAILAALLVAAVPIASAQTMADAGVHREGTHQIVAVKNDAGGDLQVFETLHLANRGDTAYEGTLHVLLDDDATIVYTYLQEVNGTLYPGGGNIAADRWTATPEGDLVRHSITLSDVGYTIEANHLVTFQIGYTLPATATTLARGFAEATPAVDFEITLAAGLIPTSAELTLEHRPGSHTWETPVERPTFAATERFDVAINEGANATEPLRADVTASGRDSITLRATTTGAVGDVSYKWFLDNKELAGETGATLAVDPELTGAHTYRVVVTDSAAPPRTTQATYGWTKTVIETEAPVGNGGDAATGGISPAVAAAIGALVGGAILYGLVVGGLVGGKKAVDTRPSGASSIAAESKEMLAVRKRTQMAALKELELAKKKGEITEGQYLPLKEELKAQTVKVMRELEKRETETV